jgi:ABC-2 type transport system permease protein
MMSTIARHEARLLRADSALLLTLALLLLVASYAVLTGRAWLEERAAAVTGITAQRDELRADQQAALASKPPRSPKEGPPAQMSYAPRDVAVLPPSPLGGLTSGQADLHAFVAEIRLFSSRSTLFTNANLENPAVLATGRFDLAFVLLSLLPLFLLAFTYNLLSAEREGGTLAMVLSQPVTLRSLLAGKLMVRGTAVLLPAVLLAWGGTLVASGRWPTGDDLALFGMLAVAVLVYGLFWLAVAAMVTAKGQSSATNAVALGGLWLLLVILVPSMLNVVVRTALPPPSRPELANQARATLVAAERRGEQVLGDFYTLHPEMKPAVAGGEMEGARQYWAVMKQSETQVAPAMARFEENLLRQQQLVSACQFLSPAIAMQEILNEISGNSTARHRHFRQQAAEHLEQWHSLMAPRLFRGASLRASDYDWIPRYRYREEPLNARLGRLSVSLLAVVLPAFLAGLFAIRRLRRYSVV